MGLPIGKFFLTINPVAPINWIILLILWLSVKKPVLDKKMKKTSNSVRWIILMLIFILVNGILWSFIWCPIFTSDFFKEGPEAIIGMLFSIGCNWST